MLFIVCLLEMGKSRFQPLVPSMEWYFEGLDLLKKLGGIYLIDVLCLLFLRVNHLQR